ncbi:hypothetical protein, partial [Corynebacterium glaucum]|uniref:hypothetical protein n=1 Tax=Corynebacterium glaucum TaxID=187491 RepID=UPI0031D842D9
PGSNSPQKHQTITAQCVLQKKQAVKSPNPTKTNHPTQNRAGLAIQKLLHVVAVSDEEKPTNNTVLKKYS